MEVAKKLNTSQYAYYESGMYLITTYFLYELLKLYKDISDDEIFINNKSLFNIIYIVFYKRLDSIKKSTSFFIGKKLAYMCLLPFIGLIRIVSPNISTTFLTLPCGSNFC